MSITDIPQVDPEQVDPDIEEIDLDLDPDAPFHMAQLRDELARSRMREAFWISVIVHMVVIFLLYTSPKWFPDFRGNVIAVNPAEAMMHDPNMTYLEMPRDQIHPKVRPNTNIISDKDRIAMARRPDNSRAPEVPRNVMPPGPPQPAGPRATQPAQQAQASPPPQPGPQGQQNGGGQRPPDNANMTAKLETPPSASPRQVFGGGVQSAGSMIEQAARGAAMSRGGGAGGNFGLGDGNPHGQVGPMDILSDTMGVDFSSYLQRVLVAVRENWYNLIPEVAKPPLMKRGKVSIEFAILKNGQVAGMRVIGPSGDVSLDRAAYGGISASNPFQPLPSEFKGEYLALRFHFYYNPQRGDLQ